MKKDEIIAPEEEKESDEFFERFAFTIDPGQEPTRIDKFIVQRLGQNFSRTKIQYAADVGSILVNEKPVKSNYKVRPNDQVRILLVRPDENLNLIPQDIPLDILYEDDDLMVINKQAGLVCHPGLGNWSGTLINAALFHFAQLPKGNQEFRPGLVHRLDKDTTGVMVLAKTEFSLAHLAKQFFDRTTDRKYKALVWGNVEAESGRVEGNIGRDSRERRQYQVYPEGDQGKPAVTHYTVLERFNYCTLVECKLETGRTHQIRVHMKYIGHTLFNDARYAGNHILKGTVYTKYKQFIDNCFKILPRQALHAYTLGFTHPVTGKRLFFEKPLPPEFEEVLAKWRKYWQNPNNEWEE